MNSYIWGVVAGVALIVVLAIVIVVFAGRNSALFDGFSEKSYDERQQRARVKAFKAGFFTLLIYNALYSASTSILGRAWCDLPTGCFLGISIGVAVFAVTCIMNDAYFTVKNQPKKIMILFAFIAVFNALPAAMFIFDKDEGLITDGMLNFHSINLMMFLVFVAIFIAMAVKNARDKREEDE